MGRHEVCGNAGGDPFAWTLVAVAALAAVAGAALWVVLLLGATAIAATGLLRAVG